MSTSTIVCFRHGKHENMFHVEASFYTFGNIAMCKQCWDEGPRQLPIQEFDGKFTRSELVIIQWQDGLAAYILELKALIRKMQSEINTLKKQRYQ